MKINRSVLLAIACLLLIGAWFWLNSGGKSDEPSSKSSAATNSSEDKPLPSVVTRTIRAEPHAAKIKLFGRSETTREVMLKARTAGSVVSTPIAEGSWVKRGTVVCRQDINARQAVLDQARAQLKSRQVDYDAARQLVERGFGSETQALGAQSALDAAKASVKQAEIELDNIIIRAPFSGIYDKHIAEIGDYLGPGQPCGQLIELNPLTVVIELTESQLPLITKGQKADIELATGETVSGLIKLVDSRANPATRTFKTELSVPNPELKLKAGVTASVTLQGKEETAHLIPGQILSLNANGEVGVKYLDYENRVRFAVTSTIDETSSGIWVTGLPSTSKIILKGQDYVAIGAETIPTDESAQ